MDNLKNIESSLNDYFDGRIKCDVLMDSAIKEGMITHPLILEIAERNFAELQVAEASLGQKIDYLAANNITPPTTDAAVINELAVQTFTLASIKKLPTPINIEFNPNPHGIPNLGNTCFMNSALQGLASIPNIEEMLEKDLRRSSSESEGAFELRKALQADVKTLIRNLRSETPNRTEIIQSANRIAQNPFFERFGLQIKKRQEDAKEFYAALSEGLEFSSFEEASIRHHHLIGGESRGTFVRDPSIPTFDSNLLELEDYESGTTIQDLLNRQLSSHETDRHETACLILESKDVTKLQSISLSIPRFTAGGTKSTKKFDDVLEPKLIRAFDAKTKSLRTLKLTPASISCHQGQSHRSGHYVNIIFNPDNILERSDSFVRTLTPEQALEQSSQHAAIVHYKVEVLN